jgi:hypothetical protein
MTITYHNGVSIAEIIVYVPALAIAASLAFRHGFGRSSGWFFLIIFCLARIIGPAMQIATSSNPTETALYTGSSILQSIGLSPLELAAIGLLSRLLESINRSHHTLINTHMIKLIELVITIGLILGIVGGINASDDYVKTGVYQASTLSKASTALFIVSWVAIVIATIVISFSVSHAEAGEKRLFLSVAISLPFLLIRLIYSILSVFAHNKNFSLLTPNVTVLLCVALLEEFAVVVTYLGVGLTLHQIPKNQHIEGAIHQQVPSTSSSQQQQYAQQQSRKGGAGNTALKIAKKTIIGRAVMAFIPDKRNQDVEMNQQQYVQK